MPHNYFTSKKHKEVK